MFLKKFFFALTLLTLSLVFLLEFVNAQEIDCYSGTKEEPSVTLRKVKLERFGIQVNIPENYESMREDGSVQILHPDAFVGIQCAIKYGMGSGLYSETIRLIQPDPSLTLRQQAKLLSESDYSKIIEYDNFPLSGYIVVSKSEYWITFIGRVAEKKQILDITIGCDCPVGT